MTKIHWPSAKIRNACITLFVIAWTLVFHYESTRVFYLNPLFKREFPKVKLLFPPAGWIMFYNVGESEVRAEVYGVKGEHWEFIDPHRIFQNRWIGYDNIRRNVLITVTDKRVSDEFCKYLKRKFPGYDRFEVMYLIYPSYGRYPAKKLLRPAYVC